MQLNDTTLFREQCYVDGQWLQARSGATLAVDNPANQKTLGTVPDLDAMEIARAIEAAHTAMPSWQAKTAQERANIMRRWFELLQTHQTDLAAIMTAEQGKPLAEAKGEILYAASFIEWFAEEGKRLYGDVIPPHQTDKRLLVIRQPIGVVAAITPWNFPAAMITRKAGPALAAGCGFVVKPATQTPFSALALAVLAERAGIPAGLFNVVTGQSSVVGAVFTQHPLVRKLSFTGSTEVGKKLLAQCASSLKKVTLELGGNAPFIVFDDADLPAAVQGAITSKYRNSGQTCVCTNRFLIQENIYPAFAAQFAAATQALRVGEGTVTNIELGPLIDAKAVQKVETHIADALQQGAQLATGGKRHALGGYFFEPTVLTNVSSNALVTREETFGPLAPLIRFTTEAEALQLANDTEFGLAAYLYSRDVARVFRVAEALQYGMVGINTGLISTAVAPFGGIKASGFGREGSKYGINDYTELKYLCFGEIK